MIVAIRNWEKKGVFPRIKARTKECKALQLSFHKCPWWRRAKDGMFSTKCPNPIAFDRGVWNRCIATGQASG